MKRELWYKKTIIALLLIISINLWQNYTCNVNKSVTRTTNNEQKNDFSYNTLGENFDLAIIDDYLFQTSYNNLSIFKLEQDDTFSYIKSFNLSTKECFGVKKDLIVNTEEYIYVVLRQGLAVFKRGELLDNPATIEFNYSIEHISAEDNYLYISTESGFYVDIREKKILYFITKYATNEKGGLELVGNFTYPTYISYFYQEDHFLYIADEDRDNITIVDYTSDPYEIGYWYVEEDDYVEIIEQGNYLFLLECNHYHDIQKGLIILDITNKSEPKKHRSYQPFNTNNEFFEDMEYYTNKIYVITSRIIYIINCTNLDNVNLISNREVENMYFGFEKIIYLNDERLYLMAQYYKGYPVENTFIIDITNPLYPVVIYPEYTNVYHGFNIGILISTIFVSYCYFSFHKKREKTKNRSIQQ